MANGVNPANHRPQRIQAESAGKRPWRNHAGDATQIPQAAARPAESAQTDTGVSRLRYREYVVAFAARHTRMAGVPSLPGNMPDYEPRIA
ncbi:MAG: hypothetical protein LC114_03085 [Bryobacterales bacterium]|nr:hypothetical protein [Bryobacterales bacterium]